jgi:CheY-like chemotaxis protein
MTVRSCRWLRGWVGRKKFPENPTVCPDTELHYERVSLSVMVVDDDDRFRGLARRLLTGCGYRLEGEASSVSGALQQAAKQSVDVVLVDIDLPDGDGLELSRQLTAPPSNMRVVLVSADSDATSQQGATDAGAVGFLPKSELSCESLTSLLGTE